jgi:hypothetical protein
MKFFVSSLVLLFVLFSTVYSQEIYFCESYTENGVPVGPTNKLDIKPWGTATYILLDNNKQPINDQQLYVFVDKKTEDKFVPYQSKTLTIEKEATWAVTNFEFKDPGTYNVYFLNSKQEKIASNILKVVFAEGYITGSSSYAPEYEGECEMVFCEMVINDKPVNSFTTLSLSRSGGRGVIYLNNSAPFNTDKLVLKVWKKNNDDGNYNEFIETKQYRILPEWSDAFIKYKFNQVGEFKFGVYNKDDMLLASSTIVISN